jgi:hypothetical protein
MKRNQNQSACLCDELVWNRSEENWFWWIHDDASWQWLQRFALQDDTFALSESYATLLIVGLDASQEFITTLRWLDVFNADVNALGEDFSSMTFVNNHSECVFRDVVDASGLSVISLEWHTFVNGTVALK